MKSFLYTINVCFLSYKIAEGAPEEGLFKLWKTENGLTKKSKYVQELEEMENYEGMLSNLHMCIY